MFLSKCPFRCEVEILLPAGPMMPLKSLWDQLEQVANEIDSDVLLELAERDHMDAEFASVSQSNF